MTEFLFIASDYKPATGGIAAFIDNLARGLLCQGAKVRLLGVVKPEEREKRAFLENYEDWVVPFPSARDERPENWVTSKLVSALELLQCWNPRAWRWVQNLSCFSASAKAMTHLEEIIKAQKPWTVVFGHLDADLYRAGVLLQDQHVPYGILAHDWEIYRRTDSLNVFTRRRTMLKGASWIVANSLHTKSLLQMWGIDEQKIIIVHPPLSDEELRRSKEPRTAADEGILRLVTVCRLVPVKGIDTVLRALRILADRGIPCRHIIIGDGPERDNLRQLVADLKLHEHVALMGYVSEEEKWAAFRSADLYVMTPRLRHPVGQHEGFGMAYIEAAAFGLASVATSVGGIPEASSTDKLVSLLILTPRTS